MPRHSLVFATAGLLLLAACGDDEPTGDDAAVRTVEIEMVDIAFEPEAVEVAAGETIRFVFTNNGDIAHDAFIGDHEAQAAHEADMRSAEEDGHGGGHEDDPDAITVEPGGTGELTHTFDAAATYEIGCHQPGHYEAGMKVTVEVARS